MSSRLFEYAVVDGVDNAIFISGYILKGQKPKKCLQNNCFSAFYPCFWLEVWPKAGKGRTERERNEHGP